jgi:hypothetical protein
MYVCMYRHTHICTGYTYLRTFLYEINNTCAHICMYVHILCVILCVYIFMCIYTHIYTRHTHVCINTYVGIYIICMYTCMHVKQYLCSFPPIFAFWEHENRDGIRARSDSVCIHMCQYVPGERESGLGHDIGVLFPCLYLFCVCMGSVSMCTCMCVYMYVCSRTSLCMCVCF